MASGGSHAASECVSVKEVEAEAGFVAKLGLKPMKEKLLLKRLAELPAGQPSGKGSRKKVSEQI